jgi:hypothetical protein
VHRTAAEQVQYRNYAHRSITAEACLNVRREP